MFTHYQNDSSTGEWLQLCADLEHAAEDGVTLECRDDGKWVVGGVVIVNSIQEAADLLRAA